ncbi:MAG: Ig-like domain-containing protein [Verrucomicrobia bacterium]|nr:Ig-like domain-containing protein [Verrucomicrobiota bacterium]
MRRFHPLHHIVGRLWRISLLWFLPWVLAGQGELNTTPGVALSSESQELDLGTGTTAPILQFRFGFATDEQVVPGEILDSFTVTFRNPVDTWTVLLTTVDAGGAVWLPSTPGTVPIPSQNLLWTPIAYPSLTPSLTYQQAYEVTVVLPMSAAGLPLTAHFDLFNNNNVLPSQGWYSPVQVIPEPAPLALLLLGGGVLWNRSRCRPVGLAGTEGPSGGIGRGPAWMSRLWVWLGLLLVLLGAEGVQAADKTFQLKGSDLTLTDVTADVAVYYRSMRFNRALNVWNVEVALTNTAARTIQGPLILLVEDYRGTTGLRFFDGEDDSVPAKSFVDLSAEAGDGVLQSGEGTMPRTLTLGSSGSDPPALVTKVYAARRAVVPALGLTRTLDEAGRPLPQVAVTVSGPAGSVEQTSDSASGVLAFGQGEGENRLRFAADGFLPVWRRQELTSNQLALAPNPQLPRRSAQTFAVTPLGGTTLSNAAGTISLELGAGVVSQGATVVLTPLTGQTLPAFLPLGWSPLSAFWLESSEPLSGVLTGSLRPAGPIRTSETAALVKWNEAGWRWEVVQVRPGQGTNALPVEVPGVGAYALVVADAGTLAPPPAVVNQPLAGSNPVTPTVTDLTATGAVVPSASPASEDPEAVTGTAQLEIRHAASPLPSGYLLRGEVTETYVLRDGSLRLTPQYEHFIVGYQRPGDQDPTTLQAQFAVRPQLLFGTDQLDSASVKVDVLPTQPFDGQVIEIAGGQIGTSGVRILAGSGRLAAPSPMRLWRLDGSIFQPLMSPGHTVFAAFELTLDGSTVTRSLATQIQGAPTNSHLVLARVLSETGYYGLQPVERLRSDAQGALTSLEPESGERLPGLRGSGQFVLIQVPAAQALISGVARNGQGAVQALMPVRLLGLPWLALTDRDGRFQLTGPAGAQQLEVTDPRTGDTGLNGITVVDPATAVQQDLTTTPRGPAVARITPAAGATRVPRVGSVVIEFNEAVNPGTVVNAIRLVRPDNQVVPTSLSLNLANRIATLSPATDLDANTVYRVVLDPTIADPSGLPLEGTREFSFTTVPASTRIATAQLIIYEPGATNVPPEILANIPAYQPGSDAFSIVVHGQPGVADPEVPVILVNESTGETVTVLSKVDGSFSSLISGTEEDFVSATFVNLNGTRVYVPVSRQEFDDGFVGLYPQGGILEAQSDGGPVKIQIEPSVIQSRTKLRLKVPTAAEVQEALGNTEPEAARSLARPMILETDGATMNGPIKVSFTVNLLAAGYPETENPADAAVALVRVTDTEGVKAFEVLDQLKFTTSETPAPAPLGKVARQDVKPLKDGEQLFYGTVNSVIGLIPQAGIANTVFRYVLMPLLVGGHPIVVKGQALTSLEVTKVQNPLAIENPLLGGFSYSQLGKAFSPLDQLNSGLSQAEQLTTELTDLLLGRALGGAFITLQNIGTPAVPGRVRPGMVYATSGRDGSFLLVAPTTPLLQLKPDDFYLVMATHPRYSEKLSETLFALTDLSIAGVAFKNFIFRDPIPLQSSPQINIAHSPVYPAAGQTVDLQVNASQGFQGDPEINVFVAKVFPTNQPLSVVQIVNAESTPLDGNRTRWTGQLQAPELVRGVVLQVSARSSSGVYLPRVPYPISFIGAPDRVEGPIPPSDPTETKGPSVVSTSPDEDGFVTDTGEITVVFNEPIDRIVETNTAGILLSGSVVSTAPAIPAVRLSPDQTTLTIQYGGLLPDESYTLTLTGESVMDLNGNPLDQRPSSVEADSFSVNFRTTPVGRYNLPGVVNGTGAAIWGARLYVIDNAPTPMLRTFDISNPENPILLGSARVVGVPRDLVVIPNYSYKRALHEETRTNDLVAVVGGDLDTVIDDLDSVIVRGQYLRVFDMSDPSNPVEIASPIVSYRAASAVNKVRWNAPNLIFQEFGADLHQLVVVDLQEHLIGRHATVAQADTFPAAGKPGKDANGDGDYVDPGDVLPLPQRRPPEFYGKKQSYVIAGTTQKVLDFSLTGGTLGVTLSRGLVLSRDGTPTTTEIRPQYRTVSFNGFEVDAGNGSVNFDFRDYPGRVTVIDGLTIEVDGALKTPVVALVSLSPNRNGEHQLVALDITFPESPKRIGEVTFPEEVAGGGIRSVQMLKDGRLEVTTVSHVVLLEPRFLATDPPTDPAQLHPAVVGFIPNGGGRMRSVATSDYGVRAVAEGSRNEVVQSAPVFSFVNFPDAKEVVDPRFLPETDAEVQELMDQSRSAFALVPARVRGDHLGHESDLTPPKPSLHYYVVVEAPGGAGPQIRLGLEALSYAGWPLPNKGAGFPPVRAVEELTLEVLGMKPRPGCDAPVRSLTAYRLSDDPANPLFNRYLSRPFAVVYESLSTDELMDLRSIADREVLWSGASMRAFIEPNELANVPIRKFAAEVDTSRNVIRPRAYSSAATLDVSYIMGPNPPPPGGDERLDGTYGSISAHSGEFRTEATDFTLPSPRMPIKIERTIGGQDTYDGPFGLGWDFNYNQRVTELQPQLFPEGFKMPLIARGQLIDSVVGSSKDLLFHTGEGRIVLFRWVSESIPLEYSSDPLVEQFEYENLVLDYYLPEPGVFDLLVRFKDGKYERLTPGGVRYRYAANGRLETILDRYPANRHELEYERSGWLRRIDDRSVTDERYVRFGYYRRGSDPEFVAGLDEKSDNAYLIGKICRLRDHTQRDVLYFYSNDGLLVRREGIEVDGENGGFAGRNQTHYVYEKCRIVGVAVGAGKVPLMAAATVPGTKGVPVATAGVGSGLSTDIVVPADNSAEKLENQKTTASEAGGRRTEIVLDKFGHPKVTTISGVNSATVEMVHEYDPNGLVVLTKYPEGRIHYLTYDTNHPVFRSRANLIQLKVDAGPRGGEGYTETYSYDSRYNLSSGAHRNANGFTIRYTVSSDGRHIESIEHGEAGVERFEYNKNGQLVSHLDYDGVETSSEFSAATGFIRSASRGQSTTIFEYGGDIASRHGLPSRIVPPRGAAIDYKYSKNIQQVEVVRGIGIQKMAYDEQGRVILEAEVFGDGTQKKTELEMDVKGFVTRRRVEGVEVNGETASLEYRYTPDASSRIKAITHPGGTIQTFEYNALGFLSKMTLDSYSESYKMDRHGNVVEVEKGGEVVTSIDYDGMDRPKTLKTFTGAAVYETTRSYYPEGQLKSHRVSDPKYGVVEEQSIDAIDAIGRVIRSTIFGDTVSRVESITHRPLEKIIEEPYQTVTERWAASGFSTGGTDSTINTIITSDSNGNVERVRREELGAVYEDLFTYDALDHHESAKDRLGAIGTFRSRSDGYELELVNGRGNATKLEHSALGELNRRLRADGMDFRFKHDSQRHPSFSGDPNMGFEFAYDGQFRLIRRSLRNGQVITYGNFDPRNQPKEVILPGGAIQYTYDLQQRPTESIASFGSTIYRNIIEYDALSRPRVQVYTGDSGANGRAEYTFDRAGPLLGVRLKENGSDFEVKYAYRADFARTNVVYPSGHAVVEERDGAGRIVGVSDKGGEVVRVLAWQGDKQPKRIRLGKVLQIDNQYDLRGRLLGSRYSKIEGGAVQAEMNYQYDFADNVEIRQFVHRAGRSDSFRFDSGERLTHSQVGGVPVENVPRVTRPAYERDYNYDTAGLDFLISAPVSAAGGSVPRFAENWSSHDEFLLPSVVNSRTRSAPDSLGRVTGAELMVRIAQDEVPRSVEATLTHNALGNLVRIERADGVVIENFFQPSGLRYGRRVLVGGVEIERRHFVYDDESRLLEEFSVVGEESRVVARYFYLEADVPYAADLIDADGNLQRHYYLFDDQFSIIAVADQEGEVRERVWYDPFGQPVIEPRDDKSPMVKRVIVAGDGRILIELSEPVYALFPAVEGQSGIVRLRPEFGDFVTGPAGFTEFPERVPGFEANSVIVFNPEKPLSGLVVLTLRGNRLQDDWGNIVKEESVTLDFGESQGPAYVADPVPSTDVGSVSRSLVGSPLLFHGQYFDYECGLFYLRARFYDPFAGMFLEPDPMGYEDSVNLYAGFGNSPTVNRDPSGLKNQRGYSGRGGYVDSNYDHHWGPARSSSRQGGEIAVGYEDHWKPKNVGSASGFRHTSEIATGYERHWSVLAARGQLQNGKADWVAGATKRRLTELRAKHGRSSGPTVQVKEKLRKMEERAADASLGAAPFWVTRESPGRAVMLGQYDISTHLAVQRVAQRPGVFDVFSHGSPNSFDIKHEGKWVKISHRSLALLIRKSGWNGRQPIRLISCQTGASVTGAAQNLANKLKAHAIHAPSDFIAVTDTGGFRIGHWTAPDSSGNRTFVSGVSRVFSARSSPPPSTSP